MRKTLILISYIIFLMTLKPSIAGSVDRDQNSSRFRFAVVACAHINANNVEEYSLIIEQVRKCNPDFVIMLGGMVDDWSIAEMDGMWQAFDVMNASLHVPVYNLWGTCALTPLQVPIESVRQAETEYRKRYQRGTREFAYKGNIFILYDPIEDIGHDLRKLLSAIREKRREKLGAHVFLLMHESPWLTWKARDWFREIHSFLRDTVDYVVGAAEHKLYYGYKDTVKYITTGITTMQDLPVPHFIVFDVGEQVDVQFIPLFLKEAHERLSEELSRQYLSPPLFTKARILDSVQKSSLLDVQHVVDTIKVSPNMDIVDIGAGSGILTFPIASALHGSGRVFATDVDKEMIDSLNDKIRTFQYKNITPVLVESEGADDFYSRHTFDRIICAEVYQYLEDPASYFRQLRPSLKKDGRLFIIHFKNSPDFTIMEFNGFKQALRILRQEEWSFPVFVRLAKPVQDFVKNWAGEAVPPGIQKEFIGNLNIMLDDADLCRDLSRYMRVQRGGKEAEMGRDLKNRLNRLDWSLYRWLVTMLDNQNSSLTAISKQDDYRLTLRFLNRLILSNILRSDVLGYLKGGSPIYQEKSSIIRSLECAGFVFKKEHPSNYYYFLEFRRKD